MIVTVVSGSPRKMSRCRIVADLVAQRARALVDVVRVIDLARTPLHGCRDQGADRSAATAALGADICGSDALLLISPVFNGQTSSVLHGLFEVAPRSSLRWIPTGIVVVGGGPFGLATAHHQLLGLLSSHRALVNPEFVFAQAPEVDTQIGIDLDRRLASLAESTIALAACVGTMIHSARGRPVA